MIGVHLSCLAHSVPTPLRRVPTSIATREARAVLMGMRGVSVTLGSKATIAKSAFQSMGVLLVVMVLLVNCRSQNARGLGVVETDSACPDIRDANVMYTFDGMPTVARETKS